jgi:hypothetical protein
MAVQVGAVKIYVAAVLGAQDKKKNWVKLTLPQKSMVL